MTPVSHNLCNYTTEGKQLLGSNPKVERASFHHKPATTRCSPPDFRQSKKYYQRSCPRAKDLLWITTERPVISYFKENGHGLQARSCKIPLLKKKQVETCLKFAQQHLDKPVNYWENIIWSDEIKFLGCLSTHRLWTSKDTEYHPQNTNKKVKSGGENIMV